MLRERRMSRLGHVWRSESIATDALDTSMYKKPLVRLKTRRSETLKNYLRLLGVDDQLDKRLEIGKNGGGCA